MTEIYLRVHNGNGAALPDKDYEVKLRARIITFSLSLATLHSRSLVKERLELWNNLGLVSQVVS